ncbi:hypothetical protein IW150_006600, partial [Coemansia sp. RSA 2607]
AGTATFRVARTSAGTTTSTASQRLATIMTLTLCTRTRAEKPTFTSWKTLRSAEI